MNSCAVSKLRHRLPYDGKKPLSMLSKRGLPHTARGVVVLPLTWGLQSGTCVGLGDLASGFPTWVGV